MKKILVFLAVLSFFPFAPAFAVTYDQLLAHHPSTTGPFWGQYCQYKNIQWLSHKPYFEGATDQQMKEAEQDAMDGELDDRGQIDVGSVDFAGNGKKEYLKVIWTAYGGPAKGLIIEIYSDKALKHKIVAVSLEKDGDSPNFKIEAVDGHGSLELITFVGIPANDNDPRFDDMILQVKVFKYNNGKLELIRQYQTKNKYEPFYLPPPGVLPI
jgi:hypothetical protein